MSPHHGLRGRLSYAHIASTLALALVVGGGTAYAAGLVGTDDLAKGAVTKPKIAKDAVVSKKIKNGSVKSADLATTPVSNAVVRTSQIVFAVQPGGTGQYLDGMASCVTGEQVLGGGYDITPEVSVGSQPNVLVLDSRPSAPLEAVPTAGSPATGWYVEARRNDTDFAATVNIWVLCGS